MDAAHRLTLVLLHSGRVPWGIKKVWYLSGAGEDFLEVERSWGDHNASYAFSSLEELTEYYCKFYKLGTHGGNNERSHPSTCTAD